MKHNKRSLKSSRLSKASYCATLLYAPTQNKWFPNYRYFFASIFFPSVKLNIAQVGTIRNQSGNLERIFRQTVLHWFYNDIFVTYCTDICNLMNFTWYNSHLGSRIIYLFSQSLPRKGTSNNMLFTLKVLN